MRFSESVARKKSWGNSKINTSYKLSVPHCFIATDVTDFQTKRFLFRVNAAIPKIFGFYAIDYDKTVFINFDFAIGVPVATHYQLNERRYRANPLHLRRLFEKQQNRRECGGFRFI